MIKKLLRLVLNILLWPLVLLPARMVSKLTMVALRRYATSKPPADGLRFLFELDQELYWLQGTLSVDYGDGLHTKHHHMKYHDFFVDRISVGERVLDVGCGIGAVAHSVASRTGAHVTGIDYSAESIAVAHERYNLPQLEFIVGDATRSLPDQSFDVVILSNVLEHIVDRPSLLQFIRDTVSAQRFLIRVPLYERDWRVPLKQELGVEWRLDTDHKTEYTVEQFYEEMAEAGMKVARLEVHWGEIWSEVVPVDST